VCVEVNSVCVEVDTVCVWRCVCVEVDGVCVYGDGDFVCVRVWKWTVCV